AGRGRKGWRQAVHRGVRDAAVRGVRGGVLVVDRFDSRTGEIRRRRRAVGAGTRLAGFCGARHAGSRSAAMKLESLRVELRRRSPWEAVELGTALVRRNAAAIWIPWLLLVAPVFVAVNLAALAVDRIWMAWLAMWWLKPLFDRIPLYVLSRAVFGETPTTR